MASSRSSPFTHGPSEIWKKRGVARRIALEQQRLGSRLRELRHACGLTLEEASEAAGVHPGHLGSIERGVVNVTIGVLVALAKALRVDVADFFLEGSTPVRNPRSTRSAAPRKAAARKKTRRP